MRCLLLVVTLAACASDVREFATSTQDLSAQLRAERLGEIRDVAAEMGMTNAALLGGIAESETGLAQCQSEATFACMGPASPSCNGGPVIAGSADGPCANAQGGLGMFQFDAGTYTQTLATYGDDVLTVHGSAALAVNFVVDKAKLDIDGVTDWRSAMAWLDAVPLANGKTDPIVNQWGTLMACRYNGCCSTSATCTTRANGYRDNALKVFAEVGAEFFDVSTRCAAIPTDGAIAPRSACYLAAGDPRYWHREDGLAGEWTKTTKATAPESYAEWHLHPSGPGMLHLEIEIPAMHDMATMAHYEIHHAGIVDTITIDQATTNGTVPLGDFAFAATGDEYVLLGDNTGDATAVELVFGTLHVTGDGIGGGGGGGDDAGGDDAANASGGCSTGSPGGAIVLALIALRRRRR